MIESVFLAIREKYKIDDENCEDIPQYLYQETRCRPHFGKSSLHSYFKNKILLSPMLDPLLRTLKLNTPECPDYQLLITFLLTRYEPDLLTLPFDSNHPIAPEPIAYAQKINERFPLVKKDKKKCIGGTFCLQPRDLQAEKILTESRNNPNIPDNLSKTCLTAMFDSNRTYEMFTAYFNSELYHYAANYYDATVYGRTWYMVGVVGITKVLEDVEISRHNRPLCRDLQHFIEQDFAIIHKGTQPADKFKPYFTARITLKLITEGSLEILSVSDDRADITTPAWLQKNGKCYLIFSYAGNLGIAAKASANLRLSLGMRVINHEAESENLPYRIDYTTLIVNGKTIFDTITPVWFNKPYSHSMEVKAGEEIKIQVEWLPHRSDV